MINEIKSRRKDSMSFISYLVTMIKIAVCDDNKTIAAEIESLIFELASKNHIKVTVETYSDGNFLIQDMINKNEHFDIAYLDIEMQYDGITVAKKLREAGNDILLIYVSNYESYCKELFELGTFRFLNKPIDKIKFEKYFLEATLKIQKGNSYFTFQYNRANYRIRIDTINFFESNKRKILIHKIDGSIIEYYDKLNNVEAFFKERHLNFLRIHQSFLVNYTYVFAYQKGTIKMRDGTTLPISEDKQKMIQHQLGLLIEMELFND